MKDNRAIKKSPVLKGILIGALGFVILSSFTTFIVLVPLANRGFWRPDFGAYLVFLTGLLLLSALLGLGIAKKSKVLNIVALVLIGLVVVCWIYGIYVAQVVWRQLPLSPPPVT